MLIIRKKTDVNNEKNRFLLFLVCIGLLLTAPLFSGILFLTLLLISPKKKINYFIKEKWNHPLLVSCLLMIIFTFIHSNNGLQENSFTNWIGLANWLPYFYCFFGFQNYLSSQKRRRLVLITFLCGSIPLLVTGFGQVWFGWHGPFSFLNGAIIWYQRSLGANKGLSGLFNNANYAGSWLVIMLPICIACFYQTMNKLRKAVVSILIIAILIAIYLTKSRNALVGTFLSLTLNINWFYLLVIVGVMALVLFSFFLPSNFQILIRKLIPKNISHNFSNWGLSNLLQYPRFFIWFNAFEFILEKPFIGWGVASFPILFEEKNNLWRWHTHNIFFELSISYGLIVSTTLAIFIILILFKSFKQIYTNNINLDLPDRNSLIFDKAWWSASCALIISQLFDVQYFDFRVGMMFWILLSGLACTIEEKKSPKF
tara:strand:- start:204 stop:1484 length:1281 start_codon:yes stop_codon:yes gene_type:complete